ncbi:MAG: excinuclease ABC subunit C [Bacteroidales bacterium]|nr:excinuclease ABC subunit C [Bacteroidales bacterium]
MDHLKKIVSSLPKSPGVYQFINRHGEIIYIGKAKDLRSRVSSYFNKNKYESFKTKVLIKQVVDIKHIVVDSETDALFLENNLIKKIQPKYNVLLKDDKTFPWICVKNENFPRIFSTRKMVRNGSTYFGPYTSAMMVKTLLGLIRQLYKLRTCKYNLTRDSINRNRFKKCLEFHIGNCKAPCENLQNEEDYNDSVQSIKEILKGNIQEVILHLKVVMKDFSDKYMFEEAENIKQNIILLERYKSKSTIVNSKLSNIDIFSFVERGSKYYVNFLKIVSGAVVQSHTVELQNKLDETKEELLLFAIIDIRSKVNSNSKEIIVPFLPADSFNGIKFVIPKTGDKKHLLELSQRNALQYYVQKQQLIERKNYDAGKIALLEKVKSDLYLKALPEWIECFDNSNIQGSNPVASCVVFKNCKPAKNEYRHFNIKSVVGANDFASMEEIIYRRYRRRIDEKAELPQLIIIDGGKGQLNAAIKSLKKLNLFEKIPVIGVAKRLEELYFPNDPIPIYLDKNSSTLKLIQNLRNEAHRFGISFHRNKRSSSMLRNSIEEIKGIGKSTAEKLIKEFGTIEIIKMKSKEEIANIIGNSKASIIINALKED